VGQWYFVQINLTQVNGSHRLHLPVAFKPSDASSAPPVTLTSSCTPSTIAVGATTNCTANVQNNALVPATVNATMSSTNNLKVVGVTGRTKSFGPVTLAAATPPTPNVAPGSSPAGGYLDLGAFGIALRPIGDEQIVNFNVPGFQYDGQTYTRVGIVSDGYIVVGGGDNNDIASLPTQIPNPARPNNLLAPFWNDLDGGAGAIAGQGFRIGILGDGTNNWIVVQFQEHPFGESPSNLETFQVWIGINGTQDISYTYGSITDPGTPFEVGAENADGTAGNSVSGLPSADLVVTSTPGAPGGSVAFSAPFRGTLAGPGTVETDMTSSITRDTSVSRSNVTVTP